MSLPFLVRLLLPKLQTRSGMGTVRHVSRGADTKADARSQFEVMAHSRLMILVSLRTAASAEAPWALILLLKRL